MLLLSSDGMHGTLDDDQIVRVLQEQPLEDAPAVLVKAAIEKGSRDNVTAIVARYLGGV